MSSLDLRTLKQHPLWKSAVEIAEYSYHILPKLPEEEQWDMVSKLRQDAYGLTRDMAQAIGSTDPRDAISSYDYVIRALYGIYNTLTMGKRVYDLKLDPTVMLQIEKLTTDSSAASDSAKNEIQTYMAKYEKIPEERIQIG